MLHITRHFEVDKIWFPDDGQICACLLVPSRLQVKNCGRCINWVVVDSGVVEYTSLTSNMT